MGRHGRAHRHRPYPSPSYFSTQSHTNKITIYTQSTQTKSTIPRAIHPNETVGAVPMCPPERLRSGVSIPKIHALWRGIDRWMRPCRTTRAGSGVSIPKIGFVHHALCTGNERRMRPCRVTRAGTQAPPLPIPVIFFHAILHKQNNHLRAIHPNETRKQSTHTSGAEMHRALPPPFLK